MTPDTGSVPRASGSPPSTWSAAATASWSATTGPAGASSTLSLSTALTLAFCEVKSRRAGGAAGSAWEALSSGKRAQVRRIAARWLHERTDRPRAAALRFDAIAITFDRAGRLLSLEHLEGAF